MDKLSHGVRVVIPLCLNGVRVATVEASCCTMYEYEEGYLAARMLAYDYDAPAPPKGHLQHHVGITRSQKLLPLRLLSELGLDHDSPAAQVQAAIVEHGVVLPLNMSIVAVPGDAQAAPALVCRPAADPDPPQGIA